MALELGRRGVETACGGATIYEQAAQKIEDCGSEPVEVNDCSDESERVAQCTVDSCSGEDLDEQMFAASDACRDCLLGCAASE